MNADGKPSNLYLEKVIILVSSKDEIRIKRLDE